MKQNKTLKKNLKTLTAINPDLAKWIKSEEDVDWVQQIKSKNGDDNLIIQTGAKSFPAYCMKNPVKVAKDTVKTMNLYKEDVSVVVGIGLGYLTNEIILKKEKGHRLIVIEPVAHVLKLALSKFDFSEHFKKGDLILISPTIKEINISDAITYLLHYISGESVVTSWPFTVELYAQLRLEEYGKLIKLVGDVLNQILCNTGTVAGAAGGIIADNDMTCLPYVIRHRGVSELRDFYKDKPAVLVSTGPSLAKNIHHLIGLEDKVVIICVGQALRPLLAYGIKPDFATSVDFGEVNYVHFKGLMDCGIPLVTINRTYAPLIRDWQGPKFIAATPVPGYEEMATGILTEKGFIEAGGSVAHLSFGLAQLLGCNPITFIGQDLSLGETSHIPLADAGGNVSVDQNGNIGWKVNDQRCHLHDMGMHGMGQCQFVDGYYGKPVMTNLGFVSFLTVFQNMVERHLAENKNI